jgi:hypothetical protein
MSTAAAKVPLSERINLRMVAFVAIIAVLIGYPLWVMIDAQVSGGIKSVAGGYKQVDLKAMSTFTFDQTNGTLDDVPKKWRELDGQKVIVEGEMWSPSMAGPDVQYFELVYSIAKCCVTSAPQVQHFVHSRPANGASLPYVDGRVQVKGILHVNVRKEEGKVASVYELEVEDIRPAG